MSTGARNSGHKTSGADSAGQGASRGGAGAWRGRGRRTGPQRRAEHSAVRERGERERERARGGRKGGSPGAFIEREGRETTTGVFNRPLMASVMGVQSTSNGVGNG
jgi:hypothetical protein